MNLLGHDGYLVEEGEVVDRAELGGLRQTAVPVELHLLERVVRDGDAGRGALGGHGLDEKPEKISLVYCQRFVTY